MDSIAHSTTINGGTVMKKIYALLLVFACTSLNAHSPEDEAGDTHPIRFKITRASAPDIFVKFDDVS